MIVNELKPELPEEWESMFKRTSLYHPEHYEVAEFMVDGRRKALVLNRETMDLMEYYYDDLPSDTWIDVAWFFLTDTEGRDVIPNEEDVKFLNPWLNMNGVFKYTVKRQNKYVSGKYEKKTNLFSKLHKGKGYCQFSLTSNNKKFYYNVHRFLGKIFIPNQRPEEYNVVNHKDSDKTNFHLSNLEWASLSINSLKENRDYTKNRPTREYRHISSDGKILFETTSYEDFVRYVPPLWERRYFINKNRLYKGGYLESINLLLEHYLNNHTLVEDGWYTNKFITSHKVEANLNGALRINGKLTVGSADGNYLSIGIGKNKNIRVHRLVWETITGTRIPEGMVIDHIEPVRGGAWEINNEFSNLRLTDAIGNNNNLETRKLRSKPICKYSLTGKLIGEYKSVTEAEEKNNVYISIKNFTINNNIYCYTSNELEERLRYVYYKFTEDRKIKAAGIGFTSVLLNKSQNHKLKKYINTGVPAPDGFYYQQGSPESMLKDPKNTELKRLREILKWRRYGKKKEE